MSAVFGDTGKFLNGTLLTNIPQITQRKLICIWAKLTTTANFPIAMSLNNGGNADIDIRADNGTGLAASYAKYTSAGLAGANTANMTLNTWELICGSINANANVTIAHRAYRNGTSGGETGNVTGDTSTGDMATVLIGHGAAGDGWRWRGNLAEASIWLPADATEEQDIVTQLLTTTADNVTGFTPVAYWPLLSDAVATIGPNLTNNGTTTFDADHPSLSGGGGGGGSSIPVFMHHYRQQGIA